ncbi:MAG: hypothetical protein JRI23_01085 [Deltaproteobacteria bacterium]|jgi:hypothetical protein|nr:hypothetical protein [Deltaproteobacteria bacterium]MBW2530048.1 hypothetical protein [Deltaproteobacteria bacterium]
MSRAPWKLTLVAMGLLVVGALVSCSDDDGSSSSDEPDSVDPLCDLGTAGTLDCGPGGHCAREDGETVCVCDPGYQGELCESCELGYEQDVHTSRCEALPVDCVADPTACGDHGVCDVDRCVCLPGYRGRLCEACAVGYQDNDADGECAADCSTAGLRCVGLRVCDDASGEAECACAEGYMGDSCTDCAMGYVDVAGDGVCVPTCPVADLDCNDHGQCVDDTGYPRCLCEIGYRGIDCGECAPTHTLDSSGVCLADPDWSQHLLAHGIDRDGRPVLGAIDFAHTWQFHPLATLERPLDGLTVDPATNTVWSVAPDDPAALVTVDVATGQLTDRLGLGSYHRVGTPVFDPVEGVVHIPTAVGASYNVIAYDPVADDTSTGSSVLASQDTTQATTFDPTTSLFLRVAGYGGSTHATTASAWDPVDESWESAVPYLSLPRGVLRPGLAVVPSGDVYLATRFIPTREEELTSECRALAAHLGFDASQHVPFSVYNSNPDGTEVVLDAPGPEPPLVAYGSYGDRDDPHAPMRIEVQHPHAVVCVLTYEETLSIVVPPTARFMYLLLRSYHPTLQLEVQSGFVPTDPNLVPVHVWSQETPDPTIQNSSWATVETTAPSYDPEQDAPSQFCAVQWQTGATVCMDVPNVHLSAGLVSIGGAR